MNYKLLLPALAIFAVVISMAIGNAIALWRLPDLHRFPAVTRCRLCGRRIWVWQSYERRKFNVTTDNPEHLPMIVGMSGFVHCDCEGTPECTAKITSKGVSTPVLGVSETMDVSIIETEDRIEL